VGFAEADDITAFTFPVTIVASIFESLFQTQHGNDGLRFKSGGAFDQILTFINAKCQQQEFQLSRQFVLTALAGNFHGKSKAFFVQNAIQNRDGNFFLIGI
jgi:hypothetical protein